MRRRPFGNGSAHLVSRGTNNWMQNWNILCLPNLILKPFVHILITWCIGEAVADHHYESEWQQHPTMGDGRILMKTRCKKSNICKRGGWGIKSAACTILPLEQTFLGIFVAPLFFLSPFFGAFLCHTFSLSIHFQLANPSGKSLHTLFLFCTIL